MKFGIRMMNISQLFNLISISFYALGALVLGWGFWPPRSKFIVEKRRIFKGGKLIQEEPMVLLEESIPIDDIPEDIKSVYKDDKDLKLYGALLKKSKDLAKIKFYGCIGTFCILIGCILGIVALFV
jgi:hypothetical protein